MIICEYMIYLNKLLEICINHYKSPTKEVLEDAIKDFDGTLIFVSHDRYFINKFADKIIEFKNGKLTTYLGNYEDYKRSKGKEG